jgi:hypothetical protein
VKLRRRRRKLAGKISATHKVLGLHIRNFSPCNCRNWGYRHHKYIYVYLCKVHFFHDDDNDDDNNVNDGDIIIIITIIVRTQFQKYKTDTHVQLNVIVVFIHNIQNGLYHNRKMKDCFLRIRF